jgi:hypothetical protein
MGTFFRLIAGILQPSHGEVQVLARWKVIYIPLEPILFDGTLMYNLTLHTDAERTEDADIEEAIWELCEALGMSSDLIRKQDFDIGSSGNILRHSDKVIVMVAQALIYDVDLLLLSTITDSLGPLKAANVLRTLQKYVRRRGLMSKSTQGRALPFELRHDKTLLYTTKLPSLWQSFRPDCLVTHPFDGAPVAEKRRTSPLTPKEERSPACTTHASQGPATIRRRWARAAPCNRPLAMSAGACSGGPAAPSYPPPGPTRAAESAEEVRCQVLPLPLPSLRDGGHASSPAASAPAGRRWNLRQKVGDEAGPLFVAARAP